MIPDDLKFTKTHEWARVEGDVVTVGISQFASEQLGDIVFLELPVVGDAVTQFSPFGVIESVKAAVDLEAPVSGKVEEVNDFGGRVAPVCAETGLRQRTIGVASWISISMDLSTSRENYRCRASGLGPI